MNSRTFDALARVVGSGSATRRALLRSLAGLLAAGLLARLGTEEVAAKCKDLGANCAQDKHCCSGACALDGRCAACPATAPICNGVCCPMSHCLCSPTFEDGELSALPVCVEAGTGGDSCSVSTTCPDNEFCFKVSQTEGRCFPVCNLAESGGTAG